MISELDKAWMAGFWEGEGTCGYYGVSRKRANLRVVTSYRLTSTISQKDRTSLDRIAKLFGFGGVRKAPNNQGFNKGKESYIHVWMISNNCARIFLNTILPYVFGEGKRNQIINALKADAHE